MQAVVTVGAGFLLAVLWFDLMFDVQVRSHRGVDELPESVLASIAGYYRRVTTEARPMNRLVAAAMLATLLAIVLQFARDDAPRWVSAVSLVAAVGPMALAASRTVPNAVRLGASRDTARERSRLARSIYADHRFCIVSIAALIVVQLAWA
jgi:hypothetical protein